jgi:Fimbrial assembly protein (PilN)
MYQQINLYQPIFRRQQQVFSAATLLQIVGVFLVALVLIYAYGLWQVWALEGEVVRLEGQQKAQTVQLAQLDPSLSSQRRRDAEQEIKRLNETLLTQQALIDVLRKHPLGTTAGFSAQLAALAHQHTNGLWLTRIAIDGASGRMELAGVGLNPSLLPQYLQSLSNEPALSGQRFETLAMERANDQARVTFRAASDAADEPRTADARR